MLCFRDVSVYDARSNYWAGRILQGISGGDSLYLQTPSERPWGFMISCCDSDAGPLGVHFDNGAVWSFCGLRERELKVEWPLFLEDYRVWASTGQGKMAVRVERIFSDSFHLDLVSDRACMHGLLVLHYPLPGHRTPSGPDEGPVEGRVPAVSRGSAAAASRTPTAASRAPAAASRAPAASRKAGADGWI